MTRIVAVIAGLSISAAVAGAGGFAPPTVVAKIRVGSQPCAAVQARGLLWVSNYSSSDVSVVNPATNRRVGRSIPVGRAPCGITAGAGSVWVEAYGGDRVDRIDPRRRRVVRRIKVGRQPFDILYAAGAVWVTNNQDNTVTRISPRTNRRVATIRTPGAPAGLAYAGGSVWVGTSGPTARHIFRIDPATNAVTRFETGQPAPAWFSNDQSNLWVSSGPAGTASRIDLATGAVAATVPTVASPVDGTVGPDGLVWVPGLTVDKVTRIDPRTNSVVDEIDVGAGPFVLSVAFGDVWSPTYRLPAGQVWRIRSG